MYLIIGSAIAAIGIHGDARREQSVIERGVETLAHGWLSLNIHDRQCLLPRMTDIRANCIEIETGNLGIEIGDGIVFAYGRDSDLHHQRIFQLREIKNADKPATRDGLCIRWRSARSSEP